MRPFLVNGFFIAAIFSFLCFLCYPLLMNADFLLGWEEAQLINHVIDMVQGRSVFFYYEGVSYQGILDSLVALPFFYFLGISTLALKLSSLSLFALYIWSCFYLANLINREIIWVVLMLLLFPPMSVLLTTYYFASYALICFLGNVIFILFCRLQSSEKPSLTVVFFLFFVMGLSIYTFTYSILYISTVFILFVLSQPEWSKVRSIFSLTKLKQSIWTEQTFKGKFVFIFDTLISAFVFGVLFSYVFGGFGIDIGGISIFQINNLHKPVGQLAVLIIIRAALFGKDKGVYIRKIREIQVSFSEKSKQFFVVGMVGFALGLSPRLASIVSQETSRGGQGFDVDLIPTKVLVHSWDFIAEALPKILGLSQSIGRLFSLSSIIDLGLGFLALTVILPMFIMALLQFFNSQVKTVKKIICFRQIDFAPATILLVFPVMVFFANVFTMNGPLLRYLFPLNAVFVVWAAFVICRIKARSLVLFVGVLFVWVSFYSLSTYQNYSDRNLIKGLHTVVKREPILDVIDFVKSRKIPAIYSNNLFMHKARFLGGDRLEFRSCYNPYKHRSKCKWQILSAGEVPVENTEVSKLEYDNFAFVVSIAKGSEKTKEFLALNDITFQQNKVGKYIVYWDFDGSVDKINKIPVMGVI